MASLGKLHGAQAGAIEPEMVRVPEGWFGMGCESGRVYYRAPDQIPDRAGAPTKSGQAGGTGRTAWRGRLEVGDGEERARGDSAFEREQVRAINRGDVRSALKLFDRGFVGFSSTKHQRIRGLGALRKTFEYYLKRAPKLAYHMEQPHVSVSGGTAVATFYWSVRLGRGRPGRTKQKARKIRGRGTHVFAKQGKEWKVVHEHFSRASR